MSRVGLWCGAVAGPLLVAVLAGQALWNPRYDPGTDPISSLSLGPSGWVQIVAFVVVGALVTVFGVAVRRAGPGALERVAGVLLIVMGSGLVGVGVFVTDPVGWHGVVHNLATAVAINAGLAAAAVLAVAWWRRGRLLATGYGVATVLGCAVLGWSGNPETIAARHTGVVVLLAVWLTTAALVLLRQAEPAGGPGR